MKKIILLVLLAAAAYWGYKNYGSILSGPGAFDSQGNPAVLVFTMEGCGQPCADVCGELRSRGIAFEEVNVLTEEGRSRAAEFGVARIPFTFVGNKKVLGSDLAAIDSALGEGIGMHMLTPLVQDAMSGHFDENGKPRLVIYGANWCPHSKRFAAFVEEQKIPFVYLDVAGGGRARRDFDALRGTGFPTIYVGFRRIDGPNEASVKERLLQSVKELM